MRKIFSFQVLVVIVLGVGTRRYGDGIQKSQHNNSGKLPHIALLSLQELSAGSWPTNAIGHFAWPDAPCYPAQADKIKRRG
jgi:hypothetical protein